MVQISRRSARIYRALDDPMIEFLATTASEPAVALATMRAAVWMETARFSPAVMGLVYRLTYKKKSLKEGAEELKRAGVTTWFEEDAAMVAELVVATGAARGVIDGLLKGVRKEEKRSVYRVDGASVLRGFDPKASPDAASVPASNRFCPSYARLLPLDRRRRYAARFIERALEPVLDLRDVRAALEEAEVPADFQEYRALIALMGERVEENEAVPLFMRGRTKEARKAGSKEWKAWKEWNPNWLRPSLGMHILAAFIEGNNIAHRRKWAKMMSLDEVERLHGVRALLAADDVDRKTARSEIEALESHLVERDESRLFISEIVDIVCAAWVDSDIGRHYVVELFADQAKLRGALGLEALLRQVIQLAREGTTSPIGNVADIVGQRHVKLAWELALEGLATISPESPQRHVWKITNGVYRNDYTLSLDRSRAADPDSMRALDVRQLGRKTVDWMSRGEQTLCRLMTARYASQLEPNELATALELLAGSEVLFEGCPIELVEARLMVVEHDDKSITVSVRPKGPANTPLPSEGGWICIQPDPAMQRVTEVLGGDVRVPARARQRLVARLEALSERKVSVVAELPEFTTVRRVDGDPTTVVRMFPQRGALEIQVGVEPQGPGTTMSVPGEGLPEEVTEGSGGLVRVHRDLAAEAELAEPFAQLLGDLTGVLEGESLLEMLALVRDKSECGEARVEWPHGEPLELPRLLSGTAFSFSSNRAGNWFELQGDAELDDGLVIKFAQLLAARQGRFVTLEDGTVVELTDALVEQVDRARKLGDIDDEIVRFSEFVALDDDSVELPLGEEFISRSKELRAALAAKPRVPRKFVGELMPYQREGYVWMSRLTDIGLGVCLADDMGLGKTVQTLALLLRRAKSGPTLVIAPTSVCANWRAEAKKFAPSLQVVDARDDRDALEKASAGELVVVSYGLLRNEIERAAKQEWGTIVLDEAQAIKNPDTHQARAVFSLNAKARVACTGTPIENRLDELWSLFRFLMPGYLGKRKDFQRTISVPIEEGDDVAKEKLQRKVLPFVLRRTKREVLTELPQKTEQIQWLDFTPQEAAFYEARRRMARQALEGLSDKPQNRIKVLSEITRLRQACCSAALIDPELNLPSSKIEALLESLDDVLGSDNSALVFSQFVSFLNLIEEELKAAGVSYRRLDGSTPAKKRAKDVAAFQAGEFDVFLISLKAGGTGLNLTRASYVFIMDPWWNPAVEDQAADRAHRIGQELPVTVTRFVALDTIEARIIELHESKRELADAVLGAEASNTKLELDELIGLVGGDE